MLQKIKCLLNFNSLWIGLFFVPFTFVCCDTPTKNYTSYQPKPFCSPSQYMRYPITNEEVVAIVNEAISKNLTIKAFGARHSQTDIICTEGIPVDMTKLNFCKMNSDNVTATFGPGVTVREVGEFLLTYGRALRTTPAYGGITIGGAIGTGAHGSTTKYNSSISEQVVQMTIVDGHGNIQIISDPDDLLSFKIHLGLLGIVVDVTLFTVPLYKVLAQNYVVSDDVLTNGQALEWLATDQIMYYWFPTFKQVVVSNLTFVSINTPGNAWTNIVPPTSDVFNIGATTTTSTAYNLISTNAASAATLGYTILHALELLEKLAFVTLTPEHDPYFTEDGITFPNPAVGYSHLMVASICSEGPAGLLGTACTWVHGDVGANITLLDNAFGIAVSNLSAFVNVTKDIVNKTPTAFPMHGMVMRFSSNSDIYMSTAYKRATAHIEYILFESSDTYNIASGGLAGYQTLSQALTKTFNGRSHWGKSGPIYHSSEMLDRKLDPLARQKFIAAMKKFDPNGIFLNDFGRRLTKTGNKINSDPFVTRCGLLDNCFCSKNTDCADSQTCTNIPGYDYKVCKTINENPVLLDENSFPPMPDLLYWFNTTLPGLVTAVLDEIGLPELPVVGPVLG